MKFIIAAGLASIIVIVSGIALSFVLGDAAKDLAGKFTFEISGGARFAYHIGLRIVSAAALTALVFYVAPASKEFAPLLIVVTAAWALAYVPAFLLLADVAVMPLKAALITIAWGWAEFALAGYAAARFLGK
jgi:hypothetical protein